MKEIKERLKKLGIKNIEEFNKINDDFLCGKDKETKELDKQISDILHGNNLVRVLNVLCSFVCCTSDQLLSQAKETNEGVYASTRHVVRERINGIQEVLEKEYGQSLFDEDLNNNLYKE
jgi:hypothetical protein